MRGTIRGEESRRGLEEGIAGKGGPVEESENDDRGLSGEERRL